MLEPDLASRVITVLLDPITPENRRDESLLVAEIAERMPFIYRGVLNLSAQILQAESSVKSANLTRLSDFDRWLAAMEVVLGLPTCQLQHALLENQSEAALDTIQDHPLASAVFDFIHTVPDGHWKGSPAKLLQELIDSLPHGDSFREKGFPSGPIALSKQLRNIEKLLESQQIEIAFGRGKDRWISLTNLGEY